MKGTLINKEGKWFVQHKIVVSKDYDNPLSEPIMGIQELPLHPDDVYSDLLVCEYKEVEFEIVKRGTTELNQFINCAKLIQPKEEINPNLLDEEDYIKYKRQEETTTWDDIYFHQAKDGFMNDDAVHQTLNLNWLKEHYNVPTKKK